MKLLTGNLQNNVGSLQSEKGFLDTIPNKSQQQGEINWTSLKQDLFCSMKDIKRTERKVFTEEKIFASGVYDKGPYPR